MKIHLSNIQKNQKGLNKGKRNRVSRVSKFRQKKILIFSFAKKLSYMMIRMKNSELLRLVCFEIH